MQSKQILTLGSNFPVTAGMSLVIVAPQKEHLFFSRFVFLVVGAIAVYLFDIISSAMP